MSLARISLALIVLGSIGCATLRPVHDPAQFITRNHPPMVYITYTDNSSLPVTEPRVSGDSLFGKVGGAAGSDTVAGVYAFSQVIGSSSCTSSGFHTGTGEQTTVTC